MSNVLPFDKQVYLIRSLGKGVPIRHIAHILDISQDTVARYVRLVGEMAIDFLDVKQQGMEIEEIEVDEFYSFIASKPKNAPKMKCPVEGAGRAVHYLSVKPGTSFILNYHVAPTNDLVETIKFIRDLGRRLKRDKKGKFATKPTIISDGYISYEIAIKQVWKKKVNYRRLTKVKTNLDENGKKTYWHIKEFLRDTPIGDLPDEDFWTNNIESANRTARSHNRRVARRTNAFSKRLEPHMHQFVFWIFYHNYVDVPNRRNSTPAMEAGVATRIYDAEWVARTLLRYQSRVREEGLLDPFEDVPLEQPTQPPEVEQAPDPGDERFWMYRNFAQHSVRIHTPTCPHARTGSGHGGQVGRSGVWIEAVGLENAKREAEALAPKRTSICNICIGKPFTLGRRR
jgi:hypothetical protein